jgi:hypothetical protein
MYSTPPSPIPLKTQGRYFRFFFIFGCKSLKVRSKLLPSKVSLSLANFWPVPTSNPRPFSTLRIATYPLPTRSRPVPTPNILLTTPLLKTLHLRASLHSTSPRLAYFLPSNAARPKNARRHANPANPSIHATSNHPRPAQTSHISAAICAARQPAAAGLQLSFPPRGQPTFPRRKGRNCVFALSQGERAVSRLGPPCPAKDMGNDHLESKVYDSLLNQ